MIHFVIAIALQALVVIFVFPWINPEFKVKGELTNAIWVVFGFIILNWILRVLFVIFTAGIGWILYYLSLGFLGLIANAIVLIYFGRLFPNLITVPGFEAAFWGGLSLSIASLVLRR
jgi:putative membrane protein